MRIKTLISIIGASRGIGAQYCRSLIARENVQIIASCRNPETSQELSELKRSHPDNLLILPVDVTKEDDIARAATEVDEK